MIEKKPYVSVIIPVYKNLQGLALCLDALDRQTYPANMFEILVVNNDPLTNFFLKCENCNLRILDEEKTGSYAARNKGIRASRGNLLGFCDSDCIPSPYWIENAVRFFAENKNHHRLAGNIELCSGNKSSFKYPELYEKIFAFRQKDYAKLGVAVTANMFAYRHVFENVGFFDEKILSGGDLVWGRKATIAGYSIGFSEKTLVFHPARTSFQELIQKKKRVVSGYIILNDADFRKNPLNTIFHALSMLKPPIKAASLIFTRNDIHLFDKVVIYFFEYILKLAQLWEFTRLQLGGKFTR